jgi:hypothetical protein
MRLSVHLKQHLISSNSLEHRIQHLITPTHPGLLQLVVDIVAEVVVTHEVADLLQCTAIGHLF